MTNEIIDKYLDQQGITPGPWELDEHARRSLMIYCDDDFGSRVANCSNHGHGIPHDSAVANTKLIANSRKSLRDWIVVAWEMSDWLGSLHNIANELATENIENSLGKPWSQVREELERMEG